MTRVAIPRRARAGVTIPLTPLVDVLLILLIFFMVTATYLDLDMIPMVESSETPLETAPPDAAIPSAAGSGAVLIRLDAAGDAFVAGARLAGAALASEIANRLAAHPDAPVLVLPSPRASIQDLVDVLGAVAGGGAERVQVVRFDQAEAP